MVGHWPQQQEEARLVSDTVSESLLVITALALCVVGGMDWCVEGREQVWVHIHPPPTHAHTHMHTLSHIHNTHPPPHTHT